MKADSGLNRLVYEYFEARILYGYYKYGESLPSIKKICQMFHLAQATAQEKRPPIGRPPCEHCIFHYRDGSSARRAS